jgi:hypothetical protein
MRFFGSRAGHRFKREIYRKPGELYLTRYYIFTSKWLSIVVHKFHMSDYPVPHCHPWNFIAMPLRAGYLEHLPDGTVLNRAPWCPKFRTANEFHWIQLDSARGNCWTLFIYFRRRRDWGFLTKDGWVPHVEYNRRLGLGDEN